MAVANISRNNFNKYGNTIIFQNILLYFFGYNTEFFSFQNSPKNLDPSYKMDLDLWDCLGRVKLILQQNFMGLI